MVDTARDWLTCSTSTETFTASPRLPLGVTALTARPASCGSTPAGRRTLPCPAGPDGPDATAGARIGGVHHPGGGGAGDPPPADPAEVGRDRAQADVADGEDEGDEREDQRDPRDPPSPRRPAH